LETCPETAFQSFTPTKHHLPVFKFKPARNYHHPLLSQEANKRKKPLFQEAFLAPLISRDITIPQQLAPISHGPVAGIHRGCPSSALDKSNSIQLEKIIHYQA